MTHFSPIKTTKRTLFSLFRRKKDVLVRLYLIVQALALTTYHSIVFGVTVFAWGGVVANGIMKKTDMDRKMERSKNDPSPTPLPSPKFYASPESYFYDALFVLGHMIEMGTFSLDTIT